MTDQDLEQDSPQRVDVGAAVNLIMPLFDLFGGHVAWRPQQPMGLVLLGLLCQSDPLGLVSLPFVMFLRLVDELGQAPVEHDDLAEAAQNDVLGFEIAVDHAPGMGVADGVADLEKGAQQPLEGERLRGLACAVAMEVAEGVEQRLAANETHHVEGLIVFLAASQLIDRDDVRVLELASNLGLLEEPAHRPQDGRRVRGGFL